MYTNDIKFKEITEDEFLCYLDWLTRFKNPINNILRVSEKILIRNLIAPKYNIRKISQLSFLEKIELAQYIWSKSLEILLNKQNLTRNKLKNFLIYEETQTFNTDYLLKQIFELEFQKTNITSNYKQIREQIFFQIDELVEYFENKVKKPFFLQRLIQKKNSALSDSELYNSINDFASIKLLFLVEGISEEKLFPTFAKICNYNLEQNGVKLKSAGGKTHLLKYYADNRELFKIPIFILLDADGKDIIHSLNSILKNKDNVYLIKKGELEDILPHSLIIKSINNYYSTEAIICEDDLSKYNSTTKTLHDLYREKGFGEFQKAKFAQILKENICENSDLSYEIKKIITLIKKYRIY